MTNVDELFQQLVNIGQHPKQKARYRNYSRKDWSLLR